MLSDTDACDEAFTTPVPLLVNETLTDDVALTLMAVLESTEEAAMLTVDEEWMFMEVALGSLEALLLPRREPPGGRSGGGSD